MGGFAYVCGNCSRVYAKFVNYFHESVDLGKPFLHCLDAKQKLNASAQEWRGAFRCNRFIESDRFATFALSAFVLLLPLAFYVAVYVRSDAREVEFATFGHRT